MREEKATGLEALTGAGEAARLAGPGGEAAAPWEEGSGGARAWGIRLVTWRDVRRLIQIGRCRSAARSGRGGRWMCMAASLVGGHGKRGARLGFPKQVGIALL